MELITENLKQLAAVDSPTGFTKNAAAARWGCGEHFRLFFLFSARCTNAQ